MELYFDDVWKQRLKQVSVPKIGVEWIEGNGRSYPCYNPLGTKKSCLINSELGIN
jgi:hypothetical protein